MKRKGARSIKEIPGEILQKLNYGTIETANLVEWLAVDQMLLLENLLKGSDRRQYLQDVIDEVNSLDKRTVNTINEPIGTSLFLQASSYGDHELFRIMSGHASDIVRCWATYFIARDSQLHIGEKLEKMKLFAADNHFGVREMSWLAVRKDISDNLDESISILSGWTICEDDKLRRFASESTRPRGVWCVHISALKETPEKALPILEPLRCDKSRYVQDSVGNWLNDASKSKPDFVLELFKRWETQSSTKETLYIIKKALRTIKK